MRPPSPPDSGHAIELPSRANELATLRAAVSRGGWAVLRGEAGSGKSTLLGLATAGTGALLVRGIAALRAEPYVPMRAAVPQLSMTTEPAVVGAEFVSLVGPTRPIVVDDVQWCDIDTVSALTELAWRRPVVLVTRPDPGNAATLVELVGDAGVVVDLPPLCADDSRALVRSWRPNAPAGDVQRAVAAAAGNPLALRVSATDGATGATAIDAARRAVRTLPAAPLKALATAALAGRPVRAADDDRAELVRRGFATDGDGCITPRHDLFAQAAIDALAPSVLADIHADLAQQTDVAIDAARHFAAAGRPADAISMSRRAAAEAVTVWARGEALLLAADCGDGEVVRDAADALCLAGRYREAIELLKGIGDPERTPRDALVLARAHWAITEIDEARSAVAAGLAGEVDDATAAELLSLRSRILTRVDWDLDGGIDAASRAADLARRSGVPSVQVAAFSALGLAALMAGRDEWITALEHAGTLAVRAADVHNAVTVYDTMIFGHLLSGDPTRCGQLAADMIELTEEASAPWNGYFRAAALVVALHVDGAHRAVLREVETLRRRRLSVKAREMVRNVMAMALTDSGRELDAVEVAQEAVAGASDETSRANAMWALADAQLAAGLHEGALETAASCQTLPVPGFPGAVNAALVGAWAASELGVDLPDDLSTTVTSGFANLRAAPLEAQALSATDAEEAAMLFRSAADHWRGVSRRAELRCAWAAAQRTVDAGDLDTAREALAALDDEDAPVWLRRRIEAARRAAGTSRGPRASQQDVLARVARGLTSRQIARGLAVSTTTVETHIRRAMDAAGAATRMQASVASLDASRAAGPALLLRRGGQVRCLWGSPSADRTQIAVDGLPASPWSLHQFVVRGRLHDRGGVSQLTLARLRGAAIDVDLGADDELLGDLFDALDRTGGVHVVDDPRGALGAEDARLLSILAAGSTVRDAAAIIGWSTRTVQRRLATVRSRLGVATNREAVIALVPR